MEDGKRNAIESPIRGSTKKCKISQIYQPSRDEDEDEEESPNLPEEIVVEILARLPVQTLMRFRCVSKSWRSIISTPSFVKSHLKIATRDSASSSHRIMLTISDPGYHLKHASVLSLVHEPSVDAVGVDYPEVQHPHRAVWVVGSCNGLICIAINEKDLYLWNPTTRASARVPPVQVNLKPGFYNIFGFGYTEAGDDYKILGIFCVFGTGGVHESVVKLYSMKANSWKVVENFNSGMPLDDSGKHVNGRLHFATSLTQGFGFRWDISYFDLDSEAQGILEQPNYGEGRTQFSLGVLGDCICVICKDEEYCSELWVMKEYGVKESWTKIVSIFPQWGYAGGFVSSKPLFLMPSGEVVLVYGIDLAIYDPKDGSLRHPQISNVNSFLDVDAYVESLVSPTSVAERQVG